VLPRICPNPHGGTADAISLRDGRTRRPMMLPRLPPRSVQLPIVFLCIIFNHTSILYLQRFKGRWQKCCAKGDVANMDLLIRDGTVTIPDNGSQTVFVLAIVFSIVASVGVAARLGSRLSLKKNFGLDDLAIAVSLVSPSWLILFSLFSTILEIRKLNICLPRQPFKQC
jgi:hypothetical protein